MRPEEVASIFDGAWPHYEAEGNGLRNPPTPSSPCPYLVFEDFGTPGLTGNPAQADPDTSSTNQFFLFFRAEGLSGKSGGDLGRWGVGKFVFPRSSQASTHFGVTVRHDDHRRLLIGSVTLKAHRIEQGGGIYSPDGLFGQAGKDEDFVLPVDDQRVIDRFCSLFRLTRKTEPGLSIVIPFVDPEIQFSELTTAALKDYFLPILAGKLEITIDAGKENVVLRADTVDEVIAQYGSIIGDDIAGQISLAKWASTVRDSERCKLLPQDPTRAARWSEPLVPSDVIDTIREHLASRLPLAIRVPVSVRKKGTHPEQSHFDIYLAYDKKSDGRPKFLRESIVISDIRGARARELRAMVVVDEGPLATMLGDSENPAHTQWQKESSNFRGRYSFGAGMIDFVTHSVGELMSIVTRSNEEADPALTVDFFSIDSPEDDEGERSESPRPQKKEGEQEDRSEMDIKPRPSAILVQRIAGGFKVTPGTRPPEVPFAIEVRCAYDIRNGNPLKKWSSDDFQMDKAPIKVRCETGIAVEELQGNKISLKVESTAFAAQITGFDEARDVYVRATVRAI